MRVVAWCVHVRVLISNHGSCVAFSRAGRGPLLHILYYVLHVLYIYIYNRNRLPIPLPASQSVPDSNTHLNQNRYILQIYIYILQPNAASKKQVPFQGSSNMCAPPKHTFMYLKMERTTIVTFRVTKTHNSTMNHILCDLKLLLALGRICRVYFQDVFVGCIFRGYG